MALTEEEKKARQRLHNERYREKNKDKIKEYNRKYYRRKVEEDPEGFRKKMQESNKAYYEKNKEAILTRKKVYVENNKEKVRAGVERCNKRYVNNLEDIYLIRMLKGTGVIQSKEEATPEMLKHKRNQLLLVRALRQGKKAIERVA